MPRTHGAKNIVGQRKHGMLRDIAAGALSIDEIATKYGVVDQTVYDMRRRNKPTITAILDDWTNQFSDLVMVQKHNRMAELERVAWMWIHRLDALEAEAEQATEVMRRVDPEASPVRIPLREQAVCSRELGRIMDQICKEIGQDATTIDRIATGSSTQYKQQLLGLLPDGRLKDQKQHLVQGNEDLSGYRYTGPLDPYATDVRGRRLSPDEVTNRIAKSQDMTVSEIKAQIASVEQHWTEQHGQKVFEQHYDELMKLHGLSDEDFPVFEPRVLPHEASARREAEAQFRRDFPNAVLLSEQAPEPVVEESEVDLYRVRASVPEPGPAPEPVEEPVAVEEPEPELEPTAPVRDSEETLRPVSISDFRGPNVLVPDRRAERLARSARRGVSRRSAGAP